MQVGVDFDDAVPVLAELCIFVAIYAAFAVSLRREWIVISVVSMLSNNFDLPQAEFRTAESSYRSP